VRELYLQQFRHVDDLARQQVEQKGKKGKLALLALGLGKVGAYAAAGVGLMALAGPFGMAGGAAALRTAENFLLDRRKRAKVEEAATAIRADLSTGEGDYSQAFLEKFARDLAIAKQQQIDGVDERVADGVRQHENALDAYREVAKREKGAVRVSDEFSRLAGVSEALRLRYIAEATRHLTEQHPDLSEEARGEMGRLAGAVFTMDQSNAILEAEQSGRAKSFFSRGVQFIAVHREDARIEVASRWREAIRKDGDGTHLRITRFPRAKHARCGSRHVWVCGHEGSRACGA
ncbi:hypothetical protein HYV74_03705, partial [Candidatus Uhrbacteria bacterium]|nr:hypothetical protein [Candidatus Uhrbacteria bacterium]